MPKLAAVEFSFECVVERAVRDHVFGVCVTLIHRLLYDKVGVTVDDQARCAAYFCHPHAMDEGFVFGLVVGGSEFHPKDVLHLVALRGGQYDPGSCSGLALGAVEVHRP